MKKYIKDFFFGIIHGSIKKKILWVFILAIYLFLMLVCIIPVPVSSTSPGSITSVATVIDIEDTDETVVNKRAYTVSVYTKTKASILEYWIALLDKDTDIEIDKREDNIYTIKEEEKIDVIAKEQSIQDCLITAYSCAKTNGYDVNLDYTYKGIRVACVPGNYIKSGPESLQIGDIIVSIEDTEVNNIEKFKELVLAIYDAYQADKSLTSKKVSVIRDNTLITLDNCNIKGLAVLGNYTKIYEGSVPEYIFYEYYDLNYDTAKPKFKINKAFSSGPSGGLVQTLFVYDCITNGSLIKDKYILGTGTISTSGKIGAIGAAKQKIMTANFYQCQYFLVPSANYDEAKAKYDSIKDPSFELIKVDNFSDVITYFSNLGGQA